MTDIAVSYTHLDVYKRQRLLGIKLEELRLLYLFKVAIGTIDLNFGDDQGTSFNEKLNHIS